MIVVDASVVLDLLVRSPDVEIVEERLFADPAWNAPHLIDLEVTQVFRRWVRAGRLEADRAERSLDLLDDLPIHRWPHRELLGRIWHLRENLTAYDGAYVALAEALECALVTRDARLTGAPGVRTRVEEI